MKVEEVYGRKKYVGEGRGSQKEEEKEVYTMEVKVGGAWEELSGRKNVCGWWQWTVEHGVTGGQ